MLVTPSSIMTLTISALIPSQGVSPIDAQSNIAPEPDMVRIPVDES